MADLVVITPTRGRPDQFAAMIDAVRSTAHGEVAVIGCIDGDDADLETYRAMAVDNVYVIDGPRRSLSAWTNLAAHGPLNAPNPPRYLASLGDDHRPRTPGWDRILIDAIESLPGGFGIAYGNDLFQGEAMPTAWVMSGDLVRALGWMMLPSAEHMYVDGAILALGQALDRIVYRPDVVIEHLHPLAGKGGWDDSYRASNSERRYAADRAAFEAWRNGGGLADDAERVVAEMSAGRRG